MTTTVRRNFRTRGLVDSLYGEAQEVRDSLRGSYLELSGLDSARERTAKNSEETQGKELEVRAALGDLEKVLECNPFHVATVKLEFYDETIQKLKDGMPSEIPRVRAAKPYLDLEEKSAYYHIRLAEIKEKQEELRGRFNSRTKGIKNRVLWALNKGIYEKERETLRREQLVLDDELRKTKYRTELQKSPLSPHDRSALERAGAILHDYVIRRELLTGKIDKMKETMPSRYASYKKTVNMKDYLTKELLGLERETAYLAFRSFAIQERQAEMHLMSNRGRAESRHKGIVAKAVRDGARIGIPHDYLENAAKKTTPLPPLHEILLYLRRSEVVPPSPSTQNHPQ